ncbi:hypothetical protein JRQ81_017401 [Phrynocephalus forsythii]|uniref:Uncharacterized protein n=1 Tax=Phrynocephalus forsythii TaxID=171643 RepID=A0A9Q0XQ95_9SAUR|nr:hypothetical protein JRQ81_017401 [Phrynocephalus forsythii]
MTADFDRSDLSKSPFVQSGEQRSLPITTSPFFLVGSISAKEIKATKKEKEVAITLPFQTAASLPNRPGCANMHLPQEIPGTDAPSHSLAVWKGGTPPFKTTQDMHPPQEIPEMDASSPSLGILEGKCLHPVFQLPHQHFLPPSANRSIFLFGCSVLPWLVNRQCLMVGYLGTWLSVDSITARKGASKILEAWSHVDSLLFGISDGRVECLIMVTVA